VANPPRTELLRRKNPDGYEMKEVGLEYNRHMVTCERQLAVGIDGGNDSDGRTRGFPLGRHLNLVDERSGSRIAKGQRGPGCRKARTRARNVETRNNAVHVGFFLGQIPFPKSASHHPTVISRTLTSSDFTRLLPSKWLTRPVLTRLLPLKRRRRHQSLDRYL
jgi:hypothetical protein